MSRPALSYVLAPSLALGLGVIGIQACGGGQTTEDPPPVCYASHPLPDGGMVRNLRSEEWADLVVRSYREGQQSTQDCVGNNITWRATDRACDVHEPDDEPAPTAVEITSESVIVGRSDSAMRRPVWVITHHFQDGDGFGPVVVTDRTEDGVAVRAMGTLRMPLERARLRLRTTGGQEIVVADGERCPPEDEESDEDATPANAQQEGEPEEEPTCIRYARLMPVVGDQIMQPELRDREGHCIGPAQVWLQREGTRALENGWERTFKLAASMEYRGGAVIIHEQVTAEDSDPRDPGRPARLFRTSDADRVIYLRERGGMRTDGLPLFERAIRADGSTQLPIAETQGNGEQSGSGRGQRARN